MDFVWHLRGAGQIGKGEQRRLVEVKEVNSENRNHSLGADQNCFLILMLRREQPSPSSASLSAALIIPDTSRWRILIFCWAV